MSHAAPITSLDLARWAALPHEKVLRVIEDAAAHCMDLGLSHDQTQRIFHPCMLERHGQRTRGFEPTFAALHMLLLELPGSPACRALRVLLTAAACQLQGEHPAQQSALRYFKECADRLLPMRLPRQGAAA